MCLESFLGGVYLSPVQCTLSEDNGKDYQFFFLLTRRDSGVHIQYKVHYINNQAKEVFPE